MSDSSSSRPRISVLTAAYNGTAYLPGLFAALAAQEVDFDWEYVVVDNGSTDDTRGLVQRLARDFPVPVTLVDGSAQPGNIPYVRNLAAATAAADHLVYCDQDDIVQPGWLAAAEAGLVEHDAVMGLIRELTPDAAPTSSAAPAVSPVMNPSVFTQVPVVESCNFAVRREVLEAVGGFDEELSRYGMDDSELSVRLRKAGYRIVGWPQMEIRARRTVGTWNRIRKVFSSAQVEITVWRKHPDVFPGRVTTGYLAHEAVTNVRAAVETFTGRGHRSRDAAARGVVTSAAHVWALARMPRQQRR